MRESFESLMLKTQRLIWSIRYALFGHFLLWISGCYFLPKATSPLRTVSYEWMRGERQDRLLVYLPGRRDEAEDFEKQGLWAILQAKGIPFDVVAVDAHLGYYLKMNIVDRVHADVIEPARSKGYQEIWVVGNSMGGLGALLVEKLRPNSWDGMMLLAPFLGDDKSLYRKFEDSGGVRHWNPKGEFAKTDFSPRLWLWIKDWPEEEANRPITYLGYGDADRLRLGIDHLTPLLPEDRVFAESGGHTWDVWTRLFESMLDEREDLR